MDNSDACLVEIVRGDVVESTHAVHIAVSDSSGPVHWWGDGDRPTIPRSAIKCIQSLPLVISGAADTHRVTREELALACASHSAEPEHVETVAAWLERLGLAEDDLECGPDVPIDPEVRRRLYRAGGGRHPRYNGCSGKHAGFLTVLQHRGEPTGGYIHPDSPIQRDVTAAIGAVTGVDLSTQNPGIDGCGIPVYALPLQAMALGMARMVDPDTLPGELRDAAPRLVEAAQLTFWVSGSNRTETSVAKRATEAVLLKGGAEGVFMGALPQQGLGFALKAQDGTSRASRAAVRELLRRLGALPSGSGRGQTIRNKAGNRSGVIRVALPA